MKREQILSLVNEYMTQKGLSQNKMAKLLGINGSHLGNIRKKSKWTKVSDDMWNKVNAFFRKGSDEWVILRTHNLETVLHICKQAQEESKMFCITGETGVGKTVGLLQHEGMKQRAYYVLCNCMMSDSAFLKAICRALGLNPTGHRLALFGRITDTLKKQSKPILLLDDVGKLPNSCYRVIQLLYDELENKCGIVLTGTNFLKRHLQRCANTDKMSFRELVRRIRNKEWELLGKPTRAEIQGMCGYHGITDKEVIAYLSRVCKEYQYVRDLILDSLKLANGMDVTLDIVESVNNLTNQ